VGLRMAQTKSDNASSVPIFQTLDLPSLGTLKASPSFMPDKRGEWTMYARHFPITESNPDQCQAMSIAMGYVRGTGLAESFLNPEALVAAAISNAWETGIRHPIALANAGIVCAERTAKLGHLPDLFKMM